MKVLILGAGGHAQVVVDVLQCAHRNGDDAVPIGYLDDAPHLQGQTRLGLPVLGLLDQIDTVSHDAVILAIGDNGTRRRLYEQLQQQGERFAGVHLGGNVVIGTGTLVGTGAVVMPQRQVGEWSVVGAGAVVTKDIPTRTTAFGFPARLFERSEK